MSTIIKSNVRFTGDPKSLPPTLLADRHSGMVAGYGLRRLSRAYDGPCITISRQSDGELMPIGFSGNSLDVSAVEEFANGEVCGVYHIHNQVGDKNYIQNSAFPTQPKITDSSGKVHIVNGKPSMYFDGQSLFSAGALNGMMQNSNSLILATAYKITGEKPARTGIVSTAVGSTGVIEMVVQADYVPNANILAINRHPSDGITVINKTASNNNDLQVATLYADWQSGNTGFVGGAFGNLESSGTFLQSNENVYIGQRFIDEGGETRMIGFVSEFSFFIDSSTSERNLESINADLSAYYLR
jgi:hypothetical protein